MKTNPLFLIATFVASCFAQVADPVTDFKVGLTIPGGDKILKWDCDVDGDGKAEVLLSLKSVFEKDKQDYEPAAWSFYIKAPSGSFVKSTGTETQPSILSVDDLPLIDP